MRKTYFFNISSFVNAYPSMEHYSKELRKTIPMEFLSQDLHSNWCFLIQRHRKGMRYAWTEPVPRNLQDVVVHYCKFEGSVYHLEQLIPEWILGKFDSITSKRSNLFHLINKAKPKYNYLGLIETPHSSHLERIHFTLSKEKNMEKKGWKVKFRLLALEYPDKRRNNKLYLALLQWSFVISKKILKLNMQLTTLSGGCYFKIHGYWNKPFIVYDNSTEKILRIDQYLTRCKIQKGKKLKLYLGVQTRRKAAVNTKLGSQLLKFLNECLEKRKKIRHWCFIDPKLRNRRIKFHFGCAWYIYNKPEFEKHDPTHGLRPLRRPDKIPKFLWNLMEILDVENYSPETHHIGINLYQNESTTDGHFSSISAHNEYDKFCGLITTSFGQDTILSFGGWLGGTNSLWQLFMAKHVIYTFNMERLCMNKPIKHQIADKHMRLEPLSYRISVMVRPIQEDVLPILNKSRQKLCKEHQCARK